MTGNFSTITSWRDRNATTNVSSAAAISALITSEVSSAVSTAVASALTTTIAAAISSAITDALSVSNLEPIISQIIGSQVSPSNIWLSGTTVAENISIGTTVATIADDGNPLCTYTITADPDNKFDISGNALITTALLDYETATSHSVSIRATNSITTGGAAGYADKTFTITVTDVSEAAPDTTAPTITSSTTLTVNENAAFSHTVTADESATFALTGDDGPRFQIVSSTGVITGGPFDYENPLDTGADNVYNFNVVATDAAGNSSTTAHTLKVQNVADSTDVTAPTLLSSQTYSLANLTAFSQVLTASESVTWTKPAGSDAALFTLTVSNPSTTATLTMTAKDNTAPSDADANNSYLCPINIADAALNDTDYTITVNVSAAEELITNSSFDTAAGAGWSTRNASSPSYAVAGQVTIAQAAQGYHGIQQNFTTVIGTSYTVTLICTNLTGRFIFGVERVSTGNDYSNVEVLTPGSYGLTFTADTTSTTVYVENNFTSNFSATITSISCPNPAATSGGGGGGTAPDPEPTTATYFSASSPWNSAIGSSPTLATNSAALVSAISGFSGFQLNQSSWTVNVSDPAAGTARQLVRYNGVEGSPSFYWGTSDVPVASDSKGTPDGDGHLIIIDEANNRIFNFYQAVRNDATGVLTATGQGVFRMDGPGWWDPSGGTSPGPWTGRSSNASLLGGLIFPEELTAGLIPHALAVGLDQGTTQAMSKGVSAPAKTFDAHPTGTVPGGTRYQLHPDLDLTSLSLGREARIICQAMQTYGFFIVESTSGMALYFRSIHNGGASYAGMDFTGITTGSAAFATIRNNLRVIAPAPSYEYDYPSRWSPANPRKYFV
jgi:hypothetical protein